MIFVYCTPALVLAPCLSLPRAVYRFDAPRLLGYDPRIACVPYWMFHLHLECVIEYDAARCFDAYKKWYEDEERRSDVRYIRAALSYDSWNVLERLVFEEFRASKTARAQAAMVLAVRRVGDHIRK